MKGYFGLILVVAAGLVAVPALAAEAVVPRDGRPSLHLRTGTAGGQCIAATGDEGDGVIVDCEDGAGNRARGDSFHGCVTVSGRGQCFTGVPPAEPFASQDVECPGGHSFEITNGEAGGDCPAPTYDSAGGVKTAECRSSRGEMVSRVDCTKNGGKGSCDGTKGTGDCDCVDCGKK